MKKSEVKDILSAYFVARTLPKRSLKEIRMLAKKVVDAQKRGQHNRRNHGNRQAGKEKIMSKTVVNKILERDMPGWRIAPNAKLPKGKSKSFMVAATNGTTTKTVVIANGRISGMQG